MGGDRARPRPPRRAEPDALAAPGLPRVLRDDELGARRRGRASWRPGTTRSGSSGGRRPSSRSSSRASCAGSSTSSGSRAGPGRLRRAARGHRLDGFPHRARRRARAGVPGRAEDRPRGPARGRRLLLGARALLDRQGVRRPRLRDGGPRERSRRTRIPDGRSRRSRDRDRAGPCGGARPGRRRRDGGDDDRHVRRPARRARGFLREREGSGCTSTPRTPAPRPSSRRCGRSSRAGSARTRSSTTRTSGCSCRTSARRLFFRRMERVRRAFSVVPNYLETPEGQTVREYMDYGVQLGRRFRALKMWMTLRAFGAAGVRTRIADALEEARWLRGELEKEPDVDARRPRRRSRSSRSGGIRPG